MYSLLIAIVGVLIAVFLPEIRRAISLDPQQNPASSNNPTENLAPGSAPANAGPNTSQSSNLSGANSVTTLGPNNASAAPNPNASVNANTQISAETQTILAKISNKNASPERTSVKLSSASPESRRSAYINYFKTVPCLGEVTGGGYLTGDLNRDYYEDVVINYYTNPCGGNPVANYIVVFINKGGTLHHVTQAMIDGPTGDVFGSADRIEDGKIKIDLQIGSPARARVKTRLALNGNQLVELRNPPLIIVKSKTP